MKAILIALCLSLCACFADFDTVVNPGVIHYGTFEFCDAEGQCRNVDGRYYYNNEGEIVYYDGVFGVWISPRGYWVGGIYRPGFYPGYYNHYQGHFYHRGGGGFRGGYHGGGGHRR